MAGAASGDERAGSGVSPFSRREPPRLREVEAPGVQAQGAGVERYGIKALWEVLRYEESVQTTAAASSYRLNNNFTSMYARLLMAQEEDLEGFFELRERVTQRGRVDG